jgi:hypothetical protein
MKRQGIFNLIMLLMFAVCCGTVIAFATTSVVGGLVYISTAVGAICSVSIIFFTIRGVASSSPNKNERTTVGMATSSTNLFNTDQFKRKNYEKACIFVVELLCTPANRGAIIGDILEACDDIRGKYGVKCAELYFWVQLCKTAGSLLWATFQRPFLWLLGAVGLDWIIGR